jgi:CheY-like chemotaxis protein
MKKNLDVGQCGPDHATIKRWMTRHFDCQVIQTHGLSDSLAALRNDTFDLVLVNRKLDRDYSDGIDIIRQIKSDEQLATVPVMLVTNYPEHQEAAVAAGAVRGFGKLEFDNPITLQNVAAVLQA